VNESAAALIANSPGLRLIRAPLQPGEQLDTARQRLHADLAITGARKVQEQTARILVELAAEARPSATQASEAQEVSIGELLQILWPSGAPPIVTSDALAASSPQALDAACRGDSKAAYDLSGSAIGRAIRKLVAPPEESKQRRGERPLLLEWAHADAAARQGRLAEAAQLYERVLSRLESGERAPLWRRIAGSASTSPSVHGSITVVLEGGRFVARALDSGRTLWTLELGRVEPVLADAGRGLLIAVTEKGVVAIDATTGKAEWRIDLTSAWPEIASIGDRLFISGDDELRAVDRKDGRVVWRFESTQDIVSGPVVVGRLLALPLEAELVLLDPENGERLARAKVGDEISGPLFATDGLVWITIGADRIAQVDVSNPKSIEGAFRTIALPGTIWPPVALSRGLAVAAKDQKRGTYLAAIDGGAVKMITRGSPPVVSIASLQGAAFLEQKRDAILAFGPDARQKWRSKLPAAATALAETPTAIWALSADRVIRLEGATGRSIGPILLGERAKELAVAESGAIAVIEGGAIYGLPPIEDPRAQSWMLELKRSLAEVYSSLGRFPLAERRLKEILDRDASDLEALALSARLTSKRDPRRAAATWLRLLDLVKPGDPIESEARAAIDDLAGVQAFLRLDGPAEIVATSSTGVAAVRVGAKVIALADEPAGRPRWTRPGSSVTGHEGHFAIDSEWVRASDGVITASAQRPDRTLTRTGVVRIEDGDLVVERPPGVVRWRQPLSLESPRVLDGAAEVVAVEAGPEDARAIHLLGVAGGPPSEPMRLRSRTIAASISGDRILALSDRESAGFDLVRSRLAFRAQLPSGERRLYPLDGGWLVSAGAQLVLVDRSGKTRRIALPSPVASIALAPQAELAYVALERGGLLAVDLAKARVRGRIEELPFSSVGVARGRVIAALKARPSVLVIDAARALEAR
jgi:outer membrane protein assembly factor BamB